MITLVIERRGIVTRRECPNEAVAESWLEAGWDQAWIETEGKVFALVDGRWKRIEGERTPVAVSAQYGPRAT